jgi:hypothetical protein
MASLWAFMAYTLNPICLLRRILYAGDHRVHVQKSINASADNSPPVRHSLPSGGQRKRNLAKFANFVMENKVDD